MLQGTGSDVGKSLLVAGLARAFTRRGLKVRPFKPQNMSNNAAVTEDGGEIGRAQALQARACGIKPTVDMNPVLLKPQGAAGAQIIVQGRVEGQAGARDYQALKPRLLPRVLDSFARLADGADLILVEGAGSPAEINLRVGDIANMGFAEAADVPVLLVGDIDRGGVLASLVGTHELLAAGDRKRLKGYVINKFRGDPALFTPAITMIRDRIGLDCLGVVPWFDGAGALPAEDSVALEHPPVGRNGHGSVTIAVPRLPHIANFDDLDPLKTEPDVAVNIVAPGRALPADADLILLPGSKATRADLAALIAQGWDVDIRAHVRRGRPVLGLCGGYQMLGRSIADPAGSEGPAGSSAGLGLLDVETVLTGNKTLQESAGTHIASGAAVRGYEIHLGRTEGPDCARPLLRFGERGDGATSADGRIAGCYLHGLFGSDAFRAAYLAGLGARASGLVFEAAIEATLDRLADHVGRAIDLDRVLALARD
ncbi:MAG: cobyric acid synthase [Alphaproteobacteria bacterium]|nr:cobyric acid synthase [Alphaproteobacteria bacterium]